MNKRNAIIGLCLVLGAIGVAWAMFRTDPVVAEMQQLRDQIRNAPEGERRAQWDSFRDRMDGLTEAQRRAVFDSGRNQWQRFGQERMDEFFQLPPGEQRKRLDEIIDRMQRRGQNRNANAGNRGGGGRGGWGGGRNMTEAQRDQRRKEMISNTTPKMRAQFDQFRQMLGDRMKERGVTPPAGGGPWRG